MLKINKCLVCGSKSNQIILNATFADSVNDAPLYFLAARKAVVHGRIVRCTACGFTFTSPQFEPSEYDQIYRKSASYIKESANLWEAEKSRGRRLAKIVKKYCPEGGKLLDFGCGQGGFLFAIDGFDKIGFEISDEQHQPEVMVKIITGSFLKMMGKAPFLPGTFDVITAFDVVEHLPELGKYLQCLTMLIRPGGILILTVPNVQSMGAKLMGDCWNSFLLEHLWYFSPSTLKTFIEKFGYNCLNIGSVLYDVLLSHIFNRVAQTYRLPWLNKLGATSKNVLPFPAGLMYGVFQKEPE